MKIVFLNPVDVFVCPMRKQNPAIAAAAISALGGLASSALGAGASASMNKDTRNWQHDESVYAREWQERMYNMYQSPQALVRQQLEAGQNPFITDLGSGGSMPSTDLPTAPTPPTFNVPNFVGQGVDAYLKAQSLQAQNSSFMADAMSKTFDTAMQIYKNYGAAAGDEFMKSQLSQFDMQGQKNITRMVNLCLQREEIARDRENLMKLVENKYSAKKAQSDLDMIDQQITESVARIGKLASDSKVNEAEIHELATRCAKQIAETGYFKALGGQITQLTPYLVSQALYSAANMSLGFQTNEAEFEGYSEYRKWLRGDKAKASRKLSAAMNPENNAFINGVGQFTDAVNLNLGIGMNGNFGTRSVSNMQSGYDINRSSNMSGSSIKK